MVIFTSGHQCRNVLLSSGSNYGQNPKVMNLEVKLFYICSVIDLRQII